MSNTQNQDELEQILRDFADIGGHQDINEAKAAIQRLYKPIGEIEAAIEGCYEYSITDMELYEHQHGEEPAVIRVSEIRKALNIGGIGGKDERN